MYACSLTILLPLFTAQGLGLTVDIIPENWLLPPESTETEKELVRLRSEVARHKKTEPSFSIRCMDESNIELDNYHASFMWFEPLNDEQVDQLMQRLKVRFPIKSDFGSQEPAERAVQRQTVLNTQFRLVGITKEVYTPATDEEIKKYCEEAYPEWLDQCEQIFRNHHGMLQHQASLLEFLFLAENVGTRPATDALITIEAKGHFQIQPPSSDDEEDEQSSEDDDSTNLNVEELPRPPVAPCGQWRRTLAGHPGDALRAMDVLRRSLHPFANVAPATAGIDNSWLRSLHARPPSHDPNAFYYKPHRPSSPGSSFSRSCDQWRHDDGEEPFHAEIHVPVDQDKAEGALLFRIQASNLSKSASKLIPVRIEIAHVSAFDSAKALVERLLESPKYGIDLSSDHTAS